MVTVPGTFLTPQSLLCANPPAPNARASGVDLTIWVDGIQASVNATSLMNGGVGVGGNAVEFVYTSAVYNASTTSLPSSSVSSLNITNNDTTTASALAATAAVDKPPSPYSSSLSSLKILNIALRTMTQATVDFPSPVGGVQYQPPPHVALITPSYGR